jgi:hypothetical protein
LGSTSKAGPWFGVRVSEALDLTEARIDLDNDCSPRCRQARAVLAEEVARRAQRVWPAGDAGGPVIRLRDAGTAVRGGARWTDDEARSFRAAEFTARPEGFSVERDGDTVTVTGNDARGVMYGVGWLLRHLEVRRNQVLLPDALLAAGPVRSAPHYPLRGHQIGYRPKTNSYVGWTAAEWDQYIRELALFGANAVEVIPPVSDDEADSDHFPLPQIDMLREVSASADRYDIDLWIWFPALESDYGDEATVQRALADWRAVFEAMPRIDAMFIPGGDPGSTPAHLLLALAERQRASLREVHPNAQVWIAPQGFHGADEEHFYAALDSGTDCLDGVIFGPWIHQTAEAFRARVPDRYPIRLYPDITHCWSCQYPVPDWDPALAACQGREPINPRPVDQAHIFALTAPHSIGALTYCEGNNDDLNKMLWSALLWDPGADVMEVLRQYGRAFVHPDLADGVAAAILGLEQNWRGPLLANGSVNTTLLRMQALERAAPPRVLKSWRFQQLQYRACSDAYIRERLLAETTADSRALAELRRAPDIGARAACRRALAIVDDAAADARQGELRARVYALAEALFQSIHVQLSVARYGAQAVRRGASLDGLEYPLGDRLWLHERCAEIDRLATEPERLNAIDAVLRRTDPGPGGRYDNLGNPAEQRHLLTGAGFAGDPSFLDSPLRGFSIPYPAEPIPYAWLSQAESIGHGPLQLRYQDLDSHAGWRVVVVYGGERRWGGSHPRVRMDAVGTDGTVREVHGWIDKPHPRGPLSFDLPAVAAGDGTVTLQVYHEESGGPGRGAQVSEIWLQRADRERLEAPPRERLA